MTHSIHVGDMRQHLKLLHEGIRTSAAIDSEGCRDALLALVDTIAGRLHIDLTVIATDNAHVQLLAGIPTGGETETSIAN